MEKMDFNFIKEFWNDEFYRYSSEELEKYSLNTETKSFLLKVGLLKFNYGLMKFMGTFEVKDYNNKKFIKIGKTYAGDLCLNEMQNKVFYFFLGQENIFENSYCNSSIFEYIIFETLKRKITKMYEKVEDDALESYMCAREIIKLFKEINDLSIYPYSYWANLMLEYAIGYFYDEDDMFEKAIENKKYKNFEEAYFDALFNGIEVLENKIGRFE